MSNRNKWFTPDCDSSACAEVYIDDEVVHLRSTLNRPVQESFTHDEWRALLAGANSGLFDMEDE